MKFIAWFYKFRNPSRPPGLTFPHLFNHKNPAQLCVTGPCDRCYFYNNEPIAIGERGALKIIASAIGTYKCGNEDSVYHDRYCGDGCIHFQEDMRTKQYDEAGKALPDHVEADRRKVRYNYDKPKKGKKEDEL